MRLGSNKEAAANYQVSDGFKDQKVKAQYTSVRGTVQAKKSTFDAFDAYTLAESKLGYYLGWRKKRGDDAREEALDPNYGWWIPDWVRQSVKTESQALVLSFLLGWFDLKRTSGEQVRVTNGYGECMANLRLALPGGKVHCLRMCAQEMSLRLCLERRTTVNCLRYLSSAGLIGRYRGDKIVVNVANMTAAYIAAVNDAKAKAELAAGSVYDWFTAKTRKRALNHDASITVRGIRLRWVLYHAAGFAVGPGRLLSQIAWRFQDNRNIAAGIVRSERDWSRELHVPQRTIHDWLGKLESLHLIRIGCRRKDSQQVLCVSLDEDRLFAALEEAELARDEWQANVESTYSDRDDIKGETRLKEDNAAADADPLDPAADDESPAGLDPAQAARARLKSEGF